MSQCGVLLLLFRLMFSAPSPKFLRTCLSPNAAYMIRPPINFPSFRYYIYTLISVISDIYYFITFFLFIILRAVVLNLKTIVSRVPHTNTSHHLIRPQISMVPPLPPITIPPCVHPPLPFSIDRPLALRAGPTVNPQEVQMGFGGKGRCFGGGLKSSSTFYKAPDKGWLQDPVELSGRMGIIKCLNN